MQINKTNLRMNGSLKWGNYPVTIILHHPEFNGSIEELNDIMINDGDVMIGYNYYIRKDGTVWEGRPVDAIGANCYGHNASSIGLAFEGNFMTDIMTDIQFNAGVELCKYLMQQYSSITEIGPHKKYYNTDCPGTNFPVDRMIATAMNGVTVTATTSNTTQNNCLKLWDSGDSVKYVQNQLIKLGYDLYGGADGIFGQATFNAVEKFQADNSLTVDGVVGANTLAAITQKYANIPVPSDDIKQLQTSLNSLFNVGLAVDGVSGTLTEKAKQLAISVFGTNDLTTAIQQVKDRPICQRGCSNSYAVRWIQWRLGLTIDSVFGFKTTAAVQGFQSKNGLTPDGVVGPNTWDALFR